MWFQALKHESIFVLRVLEKNLRQILNIRNGVAARGLKDFVECNFTSAAAPEIVVYSRHGFFETSLSWTASSERGALNRRQCFGIQSLIARSRYKTCPLSTFFAPGARTGTLQPQIPSSFLFFSPTQSGKVLSGRFSPLRGTGYKIMLLGRRAGNFGALSCRSLRLIRFFFLFFQAPRREGGGFGPTRGTYVLKIAGGF